VQTTDQPDYRIADGTDSEQDWVEEILDDISRRGETDRLRLDEIAGRLDGLPDPLGSLNQAVSDLLNGAPPPLRRNR